MCACVCVGVGAYVHTYVYVCVYCDLLMDILSVVFALYTRMRSVHHINGWQS